MESLSVLAINFFRSVILFVNKFLNTVLPGHAEWLVVIIAVACGYGLKRRYDANVVDWLLLSILVYLSLRCLGLG